MKQNRYEFLILTLTAFCTGFILYGLVAIISRSSGAAADISNPVAFGLGISFLGGYFLFSLLSGLLFTAKWISTKPFSFKILMTVFFIVPILLTMAAIYYSIPYWIYHFIQYRKEKKANRSFS